MSLYFVICTLVMWYDAILYLIVQMYKVFFTIPKIGLNKIFNKIIEFKTVLRLEAHSLL